MCGAPTPLLYMLYMMRCSSRTNTQEIKANLERGTALPDR
jgi:hypothetical protein